MEIEVNKYIENISVDFEKEFHIHLIHSKPFFLTKWYCNCIWYKPIYYIWFEDNCIKIYMYQKNIHLTQREIFDDWFLNHDSTIFHHNHCESNIYYKRNQYQIDLYLYTTEQLESVLEELFIEVQNAEENHFVCTVYKDFNLYYEDYKQRHFNGPILK